MSPAPPGVSTQSLKDQMKTPSACEQNATVPSLSLSNTSYTQKSQEKTHLNRSQGEVVLSQRCYRHPHFRSRHDVLSCFIQMSNLSRNLVCPHTSVSQSLQVRAFYWSTLSETCSLCLRKVSLTLKPSFNKRRTVKQKRFFCFNFFMFILSFLPLWLKVC